MDQPTWEDLRNYHCSQLSVSIGDGTQGRIANPHYEYLAGRRYNYSPHDDRGSCRLVFLRPVLENPNHNTLVRRGRFIWCKNFIYEGVGSDGMRHLSFTVDSGRKRFAVSESNVLCLPSKTFVSNNRYFKMKEKTFVGFSSVFAYPQAMDLMTAGSSLRGPELHRQIADADPYKPGVLVRPRLGYFYPSHRTAGSPTDVYPYGLVLGPSRSNDELVGRYCYRVRFGSTTYERVHPIEMEIVQK